MKSLKYIIFGIVIVVVVLLVGCDNLKCYPEFDLSGDYMGFKCDGKF